MHSILCILCNEFTAFFYELNCMHCISIYCIYSMHSISFIIFHVLYCLHFILCSIFSALYSTNCIPLMWKVIQACFNLTRRTFFCSPLSSFLRKITAFRRTLFTLSQVHRKENTLYTSAWQ